VSPSARRTTRSYTYVDVIREMRRERSLAAIHVIEEAGRLGVPREKAEDLADRVLLYELTPEQARAKLRELARREGGNGEGQGRA